MMSRATVGAALAAIALMLGACTPSFQNPLSAPGDSEPDVRLEGVWQVTSDDPDSIVYAYVVPTDNGLIDVDMVGYRYKKELGESIPVEWNRLRVFRTQIDGAHYLNAIFVGRGISGEHKTPERDEPVYFEIVKYEISQDGVLTIWTPSSKTLRHDIEEGRLAGTGDGHSLIVTDSSENLHEYLRQGNDPFTGHFLTLRKILPKVPGQ